MGDGDSISRGILSGLTQFESSSDYHSLTIPQKLAQALIENAFAGLRGSLRRKREVKLMERLAANDRDWFISGSEIPCSFVWCCMTLGAEPSYLRKFILPFYMAGRRSV